MSGRERLSSESKISAFNQRGHRAGATVFKLLLAAVQVIARRWAGVTPSPSITDSDYHVMAHDDHNLDPSPSRTRSRWPHGPTCWRNRVTSTSPPKQNIASVTVPVVKSSKMFTSRCPGSVTSLPGSVGQARILRWTGKSIPGSRSVQLETVTPTRLG